MVEGINGNFEFDKGRESKQLGQQEIEDISLFLTDKEDSNIHTLPYQIETPPPLEDLSIDEIVKLTEKENPDIHTLPHKIEALPSFEGLSIDEILELIEENKNKNKDNFREL